MEPIHPYSLEKYAERHRADFDLHEPRPDLWAAIEKQLHAETPAKAEAPMMSVAPAEPAVPVLPRPVQQAQRWARWQYYGVAAALVLLVLAAGVGEFWKTQQASAVALRMTSEPARAITDAALPLGPETSVLAASEAGPGVDARLDTAVHGMERYYMAQLNDRKVQLGQLAPTAATEWTRELIGLDSSYQQLKRELPRHPQPEVVLTAMNRNLQIRLDILDRQLELHSVEQAAVAGTAPTGEYVLADSRGLADNVTVHHNGH